MVKYVDTCQASCVTVNCKVVWAAERGLSNLQMDSTWFMCQLSIFQVVDESNRLVLYMYLCGLNEKHGSYILFKIIKLFSIPLI